MLVDRVQKMHLFLWELSCRQPHWFSQTQLENGELDNLLRPGDRIERGYVCYSHGRMKVVGRLGQVSTWMLPIQICLRRSSL